MIRATLLICLLLATTAPAVEIDCVNHFELGFAEAGFVAAESVVDIAVDDGLALGATATAILVFDVADPDQPTLLATWAVPADAVARIALDGPWAVAVRDDGVIHALDLTDPAHPIALPASDPMPVPVVALDLVGQRLGMVVGAQTARLFNLESDAAPSEQWSQPLPGEAVDLVLSTDHVHVVCADEGLLTFTAAGGQLTSTLLYGDLWWQDATLVGGNILLAETATMWLDDGMNQVPVAVRQLRSVDLDDPANPQLGGFIDWPGATEPLQVGTSGLHGLAWDGRNLAALHSTATMPTDLIGMLAREQTVLALDGGTDMAAVAVVNGFRFYHVDSPQKPAPRLAFREETYAGGAHHYEAGGHWLMDGHSYHHGTGADQIYARSLTLHDLTNDTSTQVYYSQNVSMPQSTPTPLAVTSGVGPGDDRVYYQLDDDQIWLSPVEAEASRVALPVTGMFTASASWVFMVADDTLYRINCGDVTAPFIAGTYPLQGTPSVIYSPHGATLLLGYEDGLVEDYFFAGSTPDLKTYTVNGAVRSLATEAELILVGTDQDVQAIHAYVIGYPDKELGDVWHLVDTEYPVLSMVANGRYVYIVQGDRGMRIIHAMPNTTHDLGYGGPAMARLGSVMVESHSFALVAMEPDLAQLVTGHCRGTAVPDELPQVAPALTVAPNPFNPKTTVSFVLDRAQVVNLELFDLRGRRVRVLAAGELPAGHRQLHWDGRDGEGRTCGSGVYLARLRTEDGEAMSKLALVR